MLSAIYYTTRAAEEYHFTHHNETKKAEPGLSLLITDESFGAVSTCLHCEKSDFVSCSRLHRTDGFLHHIC
jgi:hypothetical protein